MFFASSRDPIVEEIFFSKKVGEFLEAFPPKGEAENSVFLRFYVENISSNQNFDFFLEKLTSFFLVLRVSNLGMFPFVTFGEPKVT